MSSPDAVLGSDGLTSGANRDRPVPAGPSGDLEVLEELGRGAHTAVYRVRRASVEYALKVLHGVGPAGDSVLAGFHREAALLARLNHPGVPKVYDVGLAHGRPYLVMELIDGKPLAERLHAGPFGVAALVRLGTDVADALHAAHRAGLVHRDVKPANIIITGPGRARVIDFGLAAAGRAASTGDAVVGTFDYSPPEQTGMLARPVDARADLYALGVVLYQGATGQLPFQSDDVGQLLALHAAAPVPDPAVLRPDLPDELGALIMRLLAKDPDDRIQTAQELHRALTRIAANLGAQAPAADLPATAAVLAGRDSEQAQLAKSWSRARAGQGHIVLLEGPAGMGKTSLAGAAADTALADGALVLSGRCDPDSAMPLAPLRTAVDGYVRTVTALGAEQRAAAVAQLRAAAGVDAALLRPLSPALAGLLDAPQLAAEDRRDQFAAAVASLLSALASSHGGLLLMIDDVHRMDPASRDVLRQLAEVLADTPLLLVATARDDDGAAAFVTDAGTRLELRLPIGPLDDAGAAELVTSYLAGSTVSREVVAELTTRGRGNPFTILEYLHPLIEAGALRPAWGEWRLDTERLQAIDLPTDVFELVLARIDGLDRQAHDTLAAAAALGSRFEPRLLADIAAADPAPVLAEAVERGLLAPGGDGYTFVHDRIREALLGTVEPAELRALHRRIATVLAAANRTDPPHVYALARHRATGGLEHEPDQVFTTGFAAGQLALSENAPDAAVAFLEAAAAGADAAGIAPDSRFREALAAAYLSVGDTGAARAQLEPALVTETQPLRRAALLLRLAQVHRTEWQVDPAVECVRAGLAELGRPMPRNPFLLGLSVVSTLLWWLLAGTRRPAERPVTGAEAERLRLYTRLCLAGVTAAGLDMQILPTAAFMNRASRHMHRLGRSAEYAMACTGPGMVAYRTRMRRRHEKIFQQAHAIAAELADPQLEAYLAWMEGFAKVRGGTGSVAQWAEESHRRRRWLEVDWYVNTVLLHANDLISRGYVDEAVTWCERARAGVRDPDGDKFFRVALTEAMARGLLGQEVTRPATLAKLGRPELGPGYALQLAVCAAQMAVEQDELGEPFDAAIEAFHQLRLPHLAVFSDGRTLLVSEAYGRLARCQRAGEQQRAELLPAAAEAVRRLSRGAKDPLLRAYHEVARAGLSQLHGEPAAALTLLAEAETHLVRLDAPLVHYEAARVRARALRALGEESLSRQHADQALALATRHGWPRRVRWARTEFGVTDVVSGRTGGYTRQTEAAGSRYKRRLEALQQVSAAAATVLDPQQLARVALDETLRILGAERAILFLCHDDGPPRPSLGRTGAGELTELTGYPASLVNRVATSREPLVVTGGDEGAALGSQSTVVHGLRSIMIAPLELEGRLLGVVYLDSRVAKGVFTDEDVAILTSVANQVAVSLETARAAQLEVAVQAARQQRDTADALRAAMSQLAETLDPEQVLHRLRDIAANTLPADGVVLLHRDGDRLTVAAGTDRQPDPTGIDAALAITAPVSGRAEQTPAGLATVLGGARCWLATPLTTREHGRGVLVATSEAAFTPAQLDMASALAGQGGAAYTNARLFAQVQLLATTDGLTGVFNRRHFTELATRQLAIAGRNQRPLVAMMVDIDHFKKINDTYGHATGDDVIRAVATVLQGNVRDPDVLCRYGGEEFAIVMSEMHGNPIDVAERLRAAVAALAVPGPTGPVHVTVSVGVTELKPDDQLDGLLARADESLYRAKEGGRNQVKFG